ncbi:Eukaryotic translation initiation factor 2-alpha kinase 1 [Trichuris trichiura]|uniref:non-specific serine/threonine protein kinase n=1 Tax=Trichuris trichiura TaxID=36087 RepID=A0A077ZC66_TRITR|nr:Eukaryotic translation initiation factor 2-alpha kinase 1 [Trichuris trichiura]
MGNVSRQNESGDDTTFSEMEDLCILSEGEDASSEDTLLPFTVRVMGRNIAFLKSHNTGDNLSFVIAGLLEMVSCMTEKNATLQARLFSVISENLADVGAIPHSLLSCELYTIRQRFYLTLQRLIRTTQEYLDGQTRFGNLSTATRMAANTNDESEERRMFYDPENLNLSKCRDEYFELSVLGSGGFGKVMNKNDSRVYALKKVNFINLHLPTCLRVLRGVKILARLVHPNIVHYYGAWLDFEKNDGESELTESSSCPDLSRENGDLSSNDSSLGLRRSESSSDVAFARSLSESGLRSSDEELTTDGSFDCSESEDEYVAQSERRTKRLFGVSAFIVGLFDCQ